MLWCSTTKITVERTLAEVTLLSFEKTVFDYTVADNI